MTLNILTLLLVHINNKQMPGVFFYNTQDIHISKFRICQILWIKIKRK